MLRFWLRLPENDAPSQLHIYQDILHKKAQLNILKELRSLFSPDFFSFTVFQVCYNLLMLKIKFGAAGATSRCGSGSTKIMQLHAVPAPQQCEKCKWRIFFTGFLFQC
jgi:hypothetical protein